MIKLVPPVTSYGEPELVLHSSDIFLGDRRNTAYINYSEAASLPEF